MLSIINPLENLRLYKHTLTLDTQVQTSTNNWVLTRQSEPLYVYYRFEGDDEEGTKRVIVNENVFTNDLGLGNVGPQEDCIDPGNNFTDRGESVCGVRAHVSVHHRSMAPSIYGTIDPWHHRSMAPSIYGTIDLWHHRSMA